MGNTQKLGKLVNGLTVDSNGNVAVVGSITSVTLTTSDQIRITGSTANALYLYGAAGVKPYITINEFGVRDWKIGAGTTSSGKLSITATLGGTDGITIDGSGNVGIGTIPSYKFHILGSSQVTSYFQTSGTYAPIAWTGDNGTTKGGVVAHNGFISIGALNGSGTGVDGNKAVNINSTSGYVEINSGLDITVTRASGGQVVALTLKDGVTGAQTDGGYKAIRASSNSGGSRSEIRFIEEGGTNNDTAIAFATQLNASSLVEKMRISRFGYITTPYQPAFLAYGSANATIDAAGTYLIYPSIHINRGSNYNASNGVFTAPIAGIYLFSWSAIGGTGNDVYRYYLHLNNVNFIGDYQLRLDTGATGSEYGTNGNRNAIVNLSANDTVRIFFTCGGSSTYGINDSGNAYHNFMGYFIG